jgi:GTP-binding protein LepA
VTDAKHQTNMVKGFEDVKPMVAGIYPVDTEDYEDLKLYGKTTIERRFTCILPESSAALGFGFRCGFLGMLHMEIIQERLERIQYDRDYNGP